MVRSRDSTHRVTTFSTMLIMALLAVGTAVLLLKLPAEQAHPESMKTDEEPVITYSVATPDESHDRALAYNWRGKPTEPRRIRIGAAGIDTFVQKMGVDQNKQVAVPSNIHLAGWFVDTVPPGSPGLSIIDGHVTGKTADAVFKRLGQLKQGDTVYVELGSGRLVVYQVMTSIQVKETVAAAHLFSQDPSVPAQLNLITCGGSFNKASNTYADRIIVTARLIST